jgi:hypothetical protein
MAQVCNINQSTHPISNHFISQKSLKSLAARNAATLNRTHLITLAIHLFYHLLRLVLSTRKLLPYILLTLPALAIEFYFERLSRPTYTADGDLKRAGEDLEAKGLTEWMWDVLYWTWACMVLVAVAGDWAWWAYAAVPGYSAWLAFATYSGMRQGMAGMGGSAEGAGGGTSKRQAKMEKRGGQRVQYR